MQKSCESTAKEEPYIKKITVIYKQIMITNQNNSSKYKHMSHSTKISNIHVKADYDIVFVKDIRDRTPT